MLQLLLACTTAALQVGETGQEGRDSGRPDTDDTDDTDDTTDTTDTADSGDTGELTWDCANLPEVVETELDGPRGYHDVIFDKEGYQYGSDTSSLIRSDYAGEARPFVPGLGVAQGMDWLHDGDMVVAVDPGTLVRVKSTGESVDIVRGLTGAYGVTVGPDGMVYVGNVWVDNTYWMVRVNPDTGEYANWLKLRRADSPRMVVFGLDSTDAYVITVGSGKVYRLEVDENLDPIDDAREFATVGPRWQDGLGMDACGNLYVAEFDSSGIYRVNTEGEVETLVRPRRTTYGHAVEFGSGIGGWRADAIYQPQPYDNYTVREIVVGVPSAATVRTWR